jgi:hypothetical protein
MDHEQAVRQDAILIVLDDLPAINRVWTGGALRAAN